MTVCTASASTSQALFIRRNPVQPLENGLPGQRAVAKGGTQRALHGGIAQIALKARDRQLGGQVSEHGVGQAQIALAVFKINGIDLVRHGGGSNLALNQTLTEITQ